MSYLTKVKTALMALLMASEAFLGAAALPVCVMIGASLMDYISGIAAAPARSEKISSYKGVRGIVKKVFLWSLVAIGAMVDLLLGYLGIQLPGELSVTAVVAVWVAANELLSVFENLADIGVPLPKQLIRLVAQIKDSVEGEKNGDQQ